MGRTRDCYGLEDKACWSSKVENFSEHYENRKHVTTIFKMCMNSLYLVGGVQKGGINSSTFNHITMAIPQDEAKTNVFLIVFAHKNFVDGREDPNLQILTKSMVEK